MLSWYYEDLALQNLDNKHNRYICGIDEVGRGSLAGPVVACAVVFKERNVDFLHQIDDSKKLTKKQREALWIKLHKNVFYALGMCSNIEIDNLNIYQASFLAMKRAYYKLCEICSPGAILVDGNKGLSDLQVKSYPVIKGDAKSFSIAAASILAKVYRDNLMITLATEEDNRVYGWERNAGYATKYHKKAIEEFGISKYHRTSFAPIKFLMENS